MEPTLSTEPLMAPQLAAVNRTLGGFYGPGVLESWCKQHSPKTPAQFQTLLAEFVKGFPVQLEPLWQLVMSSAIPILYVPGWLESERTWTREYLVVMMPRNWYLDLMEQLNVLSESTVCNVVDAEFENITRKKERLGGMEIDKDVRKPSLVINDGDNKWFGMKYFDTSILPHVGKIVADEILSKYVCVTIWDKTPRLSTQIIKILASFAYTYNQSANGTKKAT